jgi:hypothetical protein
MVESSPMKALKILSVAAFCLWIVWISIEVINIKAIALEACGIAAVGGIDSKGALHLPVTCPNLFYSEIKQEKPN